MRKIWIVILNSPDRELFGVSKTQMLNLSDLQEAYTIARVQNGWSDKDISNQEREQNFDIKPFVSGFKSAYLV